MAAGTEEKLPLGERGADGGELSVPKGASPAGASLVR